MPLDEFGREIPSAFGSQHHHHHHHHRPPPPVEDAPTPRKRSQPPPSSGLEKASLSSEHNNIIKAPMTALDFNNGGTTTPGGNSSPAVGPTVQVVSTVELERQRESARRLQQQYPCFAYVEKALLCEYLYKEEEQQQQQQQQQGEQEEEEMQQPDNDGGNGKDPSSLSENNEREDPTNTKDRPSYEAYRQSYCLNYIRMFFNAHLDDSWFRRRYSSLCRYQDLLTERDRAGREAALLRQQVLLLLNQQQQPGDTTSSSSLSPAVDDKGGNNSNNNNDDFRLTGSKQARGHLFAFQQPPKDTAAGGGGTTGSGSSTECSTENTMAILVSAIPSHLTDEQLLTALDIKSSKQQQQQSGSGGGGGHNVPQQQQLQLYHVPEKAPYRHRSVIVVGPKRILEPTIRDIRETASSASIPSRYNNSSSRRGQPPQQNSLEFSFECSTDPYNRTGIDADGHGGATADGRRVPLHTVTVRVAPIAPPHHPTVLSATLSTPARFAADLQVATQLAALLDRRQSIPDACNLRALLALLSQQQLQQSPPPDEDVDEANDNDEGDAVLPLPSDVLEQRLDIAVAYLRRVHLRNFYHQPDISHSYAQMLTAPYYVRMKILDVMDLSADLLAKHLDDGLARAVDAVSNETAHREMEDTLRTEAAEIERDMVETEQQWIRDHSIAHLKGRARCSFHFCNKLFQDDTFLKKHLHKKHVEYLLAEQAKCHDKSMMKAWDAARQRPVPDIVIDCGSKFGLVPVRLLEGSVPDVEDPEPSLWQEEEERQAAMQRRREEVRGKQQQQQHQYQGGHFDQQQHRSPPPHQQQQQQPQAPPPPRRPFVDVDDMPEEKVELTFDTAVAAIPAKKTKKKKRKLL